MPSRVVTSTVLFVLSISLASCGGGDAPESAKAAEKQSVAPSPTYSPPAAAEPAAEESAGVEAARIGKTEGSMKFCELVQELVDKPEIDGAINGGGYILGSGGASLLKMQISLLAAAGLPAPLDAEVAPMFDEVQAMPGDFLSPEAASVIKAHTANLDGVCTRSGM